MAGEPRRELDLQALVLDADGVHETAAYGLNLMEAVAWVAGEPHSDHPLCVSPVTRKFVRLLEFCSYPEDREQLNHLIPKLVDCAASETVELRRALMVLDWAVRALAPAWLRAAHLDAEAAALEACAKIGGISGVMAAREPMRDAFRRADAARCANWEWAVDWNDWTMTVWEDVDATRNAARTAADGIWLKEADQALDAAVCGAAVVGHRG